MVDAPKDDDEERKDAPKACSLKKQSKRRHKRRPKSSLDRNNDHTDPAREIIILRRVPKKTPLQQDSAQEDGEASPHERVADREVEDDNYMPPSEDEASLDNDEFVVPEDPVEQKRFQHRIMAMARSLKKK